MPDGDYEFTDYIDGLGEDPEPIVFQVTVTIDGDELTSTGPGQLGAGQAGINSPLPFTRSAAYVAVRCVIAPRTAQQRGLHAARSGVAPAGSIVNPRPAGRLRARAGSPASAMIDARARRARAGGAGPGPGVRRGRPTLAEPRRLRRRRPAVRVRRDDPGHVGRPPRARRRGGRAAPGRQPVEPAGRDDRGRASARDQRSTPWCPTTRRAGPVPRRPRPGARVPAAGRRGRADDAVRPADGTRRTACRAGSRGRRPGTSSTRAPRQRVLPTLPMESVSPEDGATSSGITLAGGGGYGDPLERDPARVREDVAGREADARARAARSTGW